MPLRCGSKIQLWNKMVKEANLKRFTGPFPSIPFTNYVQSPVNLVPKKLEDNSKETHLVFNLSWPKGMSANDYTPKELCSVKYKDLDHVVQLCVDTPDNGSTGKCYMVKTDIKSAFRHLPIRPQDWPWLVMMVRHSVTNEKFYFIGKSTPFHFMFMFTLSKGILCPRSIVQI